MHEGGARPDYLSPEVELVVGDVRDAEAVGRALDGVDAVVHLAARVGVGQSMYELAEYTATNELGRRCSARPCSSGRCASSSSPRA